MRFIFAVLTLFLLTTSCEEPVADPEIESMKGSVGTDIADESSGRIGAEDTITWKFFGGEMGDYSMHIVMELGFAGEEVSGRYFYSKHQKFLGLTGTYDSLTNELKLRESYNGKVTGFIDASFSEEGSLEGTWYKDEESMEQPFSASEINLSIGPDEQMDIAFESYVKHHSIRIFNGIERAYDIKSVVDECFINQLDEGHISFSYSITGANGHLGSIQGIATYDKDDRAIFRDEELECELSFEFYQDSMVIREEQSCECCRGARAHFSNSLVKSNK